VILTLFACGVFLASSTSAQDLERTPIYLLASEELPKEILRGANYRVKDAVINDGLVNIYELETLYGPLKVEGTVFLLKRISELRALRQIDQLRGMDVYLNALQHAATSPFKTAEELITDPAGTATDVADGIGRFFSNVANSISGSSPRTSNPHQGNVLNYALGQASYKREFAYQFGVDPYTSHEPLVDAGGVPLLQTKNGTIVGIFPFDHVAWTVRTLLKEKAISTALQKIEGVRGRELLIMGAVEPHARKVFEDRGWRVGDRIAERLLKKLEP